MWELTNKKTGVVFIVNDEDLKSLKDNGLLKRFRVNAIEPIRKLTITPKLIEVDIKKTKSKTNHDKQGNQNDKVIQK